MILERFPEVQKLSPSEKRIFLSELWKELESNPSSLSAAREIVASKKGEDSLRAEFAALVEQWRSETGMISFVHKKAVHPAYQRIIGMGKEALPLILKELQERGGHWIWALRAISGIDVAQPQHNLRQASEAWLAWGRKNGYI